MSSAQNVWSNRAFIRFFTAQTTSRLGSEITRLAIPLVALLALDASAPEVAFLVAAEFAPVIVVTPFVGVLVDRVALTRVYVAASAGSAVVVAAIPLLYVADQLSIAWLSILALLLGTGRAFLDVAQYSVVPRILPRSAVVTANSHVSATQSVIDGAGPALAGALVQLIGAPFALIADSFSYAAAAVLMTGIRADPPPGTRLRPRWRKEIARGFRVLWSDWRLRSLALTSSAANFFGFAYIALLPTYLVRDLGLEPAVIGVVLGLGAIGGIAGYLLAPKLGERFGDGRVLSTGVILSAVSIGMVALADTLHEGRHFPAGIAALALGVILEVSGVSLYNVFAVSFRQTLSPEADLGKVTASYRLLSHGVGPVGAAIAGIAAGVIGAATSMWWIAGGYGLLAAVVFLSPLRTLRRQAISAEESPATTV